MLSKNKTKKLSYEILVIVLICLALSLLLFALLTYFTNSIIEEYCFNNDIVLDDYEFYRINNMVFSVSLIISVSLFIILFLALFSEKISYIKTITKGIDSLRLNNLNEEILVKGNNELTHLAESINYLVKHEKEIKDKENKLQKEKDDLIRNLSHDIRTPLTSIMSYTELISDKTNLTIEEQKAYISLVSKKSKQIKELTDILLEGNKRQLTHFDDGTLLIKQLLEEMKDSLEETFKLSIELSLPSEFSINIDINEIRRVFDNLTTNIIKYADETNPVEIIISKNETGLVIKQKNKIKTIINNVENNNIGIKSIKRIAQNYNGDIAIDKTDNYFEITIILMNL